MLKTQRRRGFRAILEKPKEGRPQRHLHMCSEVKNDLYRQNYFFLFFLRNQIDGASVGLKSKIQISLGKRSS